METEPFCQITKGPDGNWAITYVKNKQYDTVVFCLSALPVCNVWSASSLEMKFFVGGYFELLFNFYILFKVVQWPLRSNGQTISILTISL